MRFFLIILYLLAGCFSIEAVSKRACGVAELQQLLPIAEEVDSLTICDCLTDQYQDADIFFISQHFPHLKRFEIEYGKQLTDRCIHAIAQMSQLTSLSFSSFYQLSDGALQTLILQLPALEELHLLQKNKQLRGTTLAAILQNAPALKALKIADLMISSETWKSFTPFLGRLKSLEIGWSPTLPPEALLLIGQSTSNIEQLTLMGVSFEKGTVGVDEWKLFFDAMPLLRHVHFGFDVDSSGAIFEGLKASKPSLEMLTLTSLRKKTTPGAPYREYFVDLTSYPFPEYLQGVELKLYDCSLSYGADIPLLAPHLPSIQLMILNFTSLEELQPEEFAAAFSHLRILRGENLRAFEKTKFDLIKELNPAISVFFNP